MKKITICLLLITYFLSAKAQVFGFAAAPSTAPYPDSLLVQFDTTSAFAVTNFVQVRGDPSLQIKSGTFPGTSAYWTTIATANWAPFSGSCIGPSNGVTNATIPYAGATGVMREAVLTTNLYSAGISVFKISGLNPSQAYTITISGTTQYAVAAVGKYGVVGSTTPSPQTINGASNLSSSVTFTVNPDGTGAITFYMGLNDGGQQVCLMSFIRITT